MVFKLKQKHYHLSSVFEFLSIYFFLKQQCIKVLEKFEFWEGAQHITMQKVKVKHLHSTFRKHFCESLFKGYVEEKKYQYETPQETTKILESLNSIIIPNNTTRWENHNPA